MGIDRDRGDIRGTGKDPTNLGILRKIVKMSKRYLLRMSAGVGHRHPVTARKAVLMLGSRMRVGALRQQTGAQYSAVEWARMAVRNLAAPAPQLEPASHLRRTTCDVTFLQSDSRCRLYMSDLSNVTPENLGSQQKGRFRC